MLKISLYILSLVLLLSCASKITTIKYQMKGDYLYGEINKEQLYMELPDWFEREKKYSPDSLIFSQINNLDPEVEVLLFFGSWCADSRRNVPIFLKVLQKSPNIEIKMWALDRKKQIDSGLHESYNIKRVPTFIFRNKETEIGRIVEFPKFSMERDVLEILNKIK